MTLSKDKTTLLISNKNLIGKFKESDWKVTIKDSRFTTFFNITDSKLKEKLSSFNSNNKRIFADLTSEFDF